MIKFILIYQYPHKSTLVNMCQHEYDISQHESERVLHDPTRINTIRKQANTSLKQV